MKSRLIFMIAILTSAFSYAQKGEIIYTDFEPDITRTFLSINDGPVYLDLDNDGISEWRYKPYDIWGHNFGLQLFRNPNEFPFNDWEFQTTYVNHHDPSFPQYGDTLPNCLWDAYAPDQYHCFNSIEQTDCDYGRHYMGVRRLIGEEEDDNWCYGWIEASVFIHYWLEGETKYNTIDLVVYRMAYCTIPNYPLCVGQTDFTTWGVEENEATAFATIHPNPAESAFTITGKDLQTAEVLNMFGQRVAMAIGEDEQLTVDISGLPTGVYFVNITDEKGRKCVKKVVKE